MKYFNIFGLNPSITNIVQAISFAKIRHCKSSTLLYLNFKVKTTKIDFVFLYLRCIHVRLLRIHPWALQILKR